ncbi:hypothetical protein TTHERM_00442700 (macronuclear) [Tetrahymena thermophila SB210]|uniref:Uncharacterized protein n=1 Tax=Tetrahymena thermophila (strain SB210) TaxID=312017 RepID=I7M6N2_TETTS|nr:hypothetical protein TTHERM_00442700 [Tetrahymena thermophila SB210]EAR85520.2 hypothetical protein TTHERM_00442700 [Tetrahymena thermophila SB210]|eukprot:XP_001033183.2 hypothetical protein TTHERM_00442700 [Tetrahymena thermophila SB210]
MSLTIIYRKLQELKEKEKKIQDFYDPVKVHKFQHPHIQDLRDDYQEDIQNYGFSRFAFKEENEASLDEKDAIKQSSTHQHNRVVSPKGNISQYNSNIKPQSAQIRPTTAKKPNSEGGVSFQNQLISPKSVTSSIRPTTANKFAPDATVQSEFQMTKTLQSQYLNSMRPQTAALQSNLNSGQAIRNIQSANQYKGYDTINDRVFIQEQEEYQTQEGQQENQDQNNQGQEVGKKIKHWKFTKKYDTNGKQAVRNQSALRKIVMEGQDGQEEMIDDEEIQQVQEKAMENRLNGQKIFITKDGHVLENRENHELNILRKYSPSEREKINFLDSFQSQKKFLSQGEIQFKKIYSHQVAEKKQDSQQDKKQSTNENLNTDPSQKGVSSSIRINTNQSGQKKRNDRPQTAVAFSNTGTENSQKNKNSSQNKTGIQFKKRIFSSRPYSASNEQIKLFLEEDQKLFNIKKIKSAVLDKNGPSKFFTGNEYSSLEQTEWNFPNLQKDFSFKVEVIDMKTMNFVKFDNVKIINSQLVHTTYKEEQVQINFEKIFTLLGKQHQPTHAMTSPQSFFHVLIYQKLSSDEETILFEKFIFKGTIQQSLDFGSQNILFLYYIRYLLCFDPTDIEFKSIYNNSLYILEKKRTIPQPLYKYLSLLQMKAIYVEDLNQKTYQFHIFPQLQSQLLVEESSMNVLYQHNKSPVKEWESTDLKHSSYNYHSSAFNGQMNENENMGNYQTKRPTTAIPYQNQNNQNYQWNSAQIDNNIQYSNTHYNTHHSQLQSPQQKQQQQKQLPFFNQQIQYSSSQSQLNTQQIISKYQHNQLPHHSLPNSNLLQNNFINQQLQKPSLPLDYIKNGQQKQGLRPKTAVSKGIRSPSASSLSGLNSGNLTEGQKRHQLHNQMLQLSEHLRNDGKKYEKNVKGFSSPMFIKGQQVKPSFNKDTGIYFVNQH